MSSLTIRPIQPDNSEAELCARLMATSDPWVTLGRSYTGAFVGYIQTVKGHSEILLRKTISPWSTFQRGGEARDGAG